MKHGKNRVEIGRNYKTQPAWKKCLGVPFIYLPIIVTAPFTILGCFCVYLHLRIIGGHNIKSYWDFVPEWASHRYSNEDHIVLQMIDLKFAQWCKFRWYWIFNCKIYCPLSVALFAYMAYLVRVVENWWCPFTHSFKDEYADARIDQSLWHLKEQDRSRLHPDDRDNPIWNDEFDQDRTTRLKTL